MKSVKIGFIGAGAISTSVAPTVKQIEGICCCAVAARSLERAQAFAEEYGFDKAYGSYEEMLCDPEVELVYVATPHSMHYEHMMMCLEHGKAVLCEKAFTVNAEQAEKIRKYAEDRSLFVAEAIWVRYMPSRTLIREVIESGVIGTPALLTANLSYPVSHKERIMRPELAGGALLDLGVYGLNFALMHFGTEIERIESSVQFTDTGVDGAESITLFFKGGKTAVLSHSIYARSDRQGVISGDKGYIIVDNINNPRAISVYDRTDRLMQQIDVPEQISGYEYEFMECAEAVRRGEKESRSMPLDETVRVMEIMDEIRSQWGLAYPGETR